MQGVEANEGILTHFTPAEEQRPYVRADKRRVTGDVRSHGDGPVGQLVPG